MLIVTLKNAVARAMEEYRLQLGTFDLNQLVDRELNDFIQPIKEELMAHATQINEQKPKGE